MASHHERDSSYTPVFSQCIYCKHVGRGIWCEAFPAGIPYEIRANTFDHRRPWIDPQTGTPGDTGIRGGESILFDPKPDVAGAALAQLFVILDTLSNPPS